MFKIGDKVVHKNKKIPHNIDPNKKSIGASVQKKTAHTILDIEYCVKCGQQSIDIGIKVPNNIIGIRCPNCSHVTKCTTRQWFLRSIEFEKVIYNNISAEIASEFKETTEKSDINKIEETIILTEQK